VVFILADDLDHHAELPGVGRYVGGEVENEVGVWPARCRAGHVQHDRRLAGQRRAGRHMRYERALLVAPQQGVEGAHRPRIGQTYRRTAALRPLL